MKDIYLYFENGRSFKAKSFGAEGTSVGEAVFNTSLTGYQEIITDPSYAGQFITFTMSEIGIVGVNTQDMESIKPYCKGVIVRSYNEKYSNFRAEEPLDSLLKQYGLLGICDIDTRSITKMLRDEGAMMMIASTEISEVSELSTMLKNSKRIEEINYIQEVSTKNTYVHKNGCWKHDLMDFDTIKTDKKIIAIDFGVKKNILNELTEAGLEVEVVPNNIDGDNIIQRYQNGEISGVFLSNGPGDPLVLKDEVKEIKKLIDAKIPMFGICLGHQLLSIAHGYETQKLKFGHHGGNHPVKDKMTNKVQITAQNHNYGVPEEIREIAEVTHLNLFDNTIEGLKYRDSNIFSVQHHPEASPGPKESRNIFNIFASSISK